MFDEHKIVKEIILQTILDFQKGLSQKMTV